MNYYKRVDKNGNTTTVECYSHSKEVKGATQITKDEFYTYIASLPIEEPKVSIIDTLNQIVERLEALESRH